MKNNIAFLGMGVMGKYMAANLMQSGAFNAVYVWNRNSQSSGITFAQDHGCTSETDLYRIGTECKTICLCLSNQLAVEDVLWGNYQFASYLAPGTTIIDFSSIGREAAVSIASKLSISGIRYVDAPVSGGDQGAKNGTLTIMVGATEEGNEELKPIFAAVGSRTFYCGYLGDGQAIKSINQLLCSIHMVALCEAFIAADKMGLSQQAVVDVCSTGAAGSWALTNLGQQIANNNFTPGFMVKHMLKDLLLFQQEISSDSVCLPAQLLALKLFDATFQLENGNGAELGTQSMYLAYQAFQKSDSHYKKCNGFCSRSDQKRQTD